MKNMVNSFCYRLVTSQIEKRKSGAKKFLAPDHRNIRVLKITSLLIV